MSFIHPDANLIDLTSKNVETPTTTTTAPASTAQTIIDMNQLTTESKDKASFPIQATTSDRQTPEKMEIKIMLVKLQAESPLLPINEAEITSSTTASTNTTAAAPTTTTTTATPKNISTTKPSYTYSPLAEADTTTTSILYNSPVTPKATTTVTTTNTTPAPLPPTTITSSSSSSSLTIIQPLNECRRRSSITTTTTETTTSSTSSSSSDAADNNICLNIEEKETNNNNNNSKSQFYTNNTNNTTHTHEYNLYPKDSFHHLEGKAPKYPHKMQTKVDAVGRITGEWGRWQLRTVFLIFLCKIPSSWFMACIIFTAPAPRHGEFYCKPPHTVGATNHTQWIKVSHPQKEETDDQEFNIDFCNVYNDAQEHAHHYYNYADRELEPRVWEEPISRNSNVIPCTEFQHQSDYHSVVTQYDLVCSREILVSVTQFFHLFGVLTGGILANHLLKYFSPRHVMLFGMISQIFCGNLTGYMASYELHVFFRCLSAVCCAQMYTAGSVIMGDITAGKYKTCVTTLFEQFWSIGVIMLPGVASFFSSWSHLYMAISWPTVILIYLWQWIPDSPRWMIARGRVLEAKKILLQCIEVNGTRHSLPHDIDQQLQLQAQTAMDAPPPSGWWSIWKGEKRSLRHMICVHLAWAIYIVVYYGMLLNIRAFSREHLHINTVIAGLSEMSGTFFGLFLILKTKRKWLWTGLFNIFAGLWAYTIWLVPKTTDVVSFDGRVALLMLTAMISKMAISTTLSILTTCTVELVSDDKKKITSFSTICWARFWLLGAPFIGATGLINEQLPQTAFASLAIVGGFMTSLISSPRTLSKSNSNSLPTMTTTTSNQAAQNMASQFTIIEGVDNKGYETGMGMRFSDNEPIIQKMTTPQSNLPPQLMPGIWTTKCLDETP